MAFLTPSNLRRVNTSHHTKLIARIVACALLFVSAMSAGAAEVSKEYQIKAAFLYNFTKFIEWPSDRFADEHAPIRIAVVGGNPFGRALEKIVHDRKVNGRAISVVYFSSIKDAGSSPDSCHVLFFPQGEENALPELVSSPECAGVLTVGESPRFAALGGMVVFNTADTKVRFEINIAAAERSGLTISAQLQKLASAIRHNP